MSSEQAIVLTGLGVVSPIGVGKESYWNALVEGRSGIRRLDAFDDPSLPAPIGGAVADFDPKQYVRPRKSLKVMSRDIQLAFAAADLACTDAGLPERPVPPERLGVVFGAGLIAGELDEMAGTYRGCLVDGRFDFHRWGTSAMADLFPLWMLKYLPNMPACHIGIAQDARGPNNSITMGDVSSLAALAEAVRILQRGQADALIVGGVGARLHPIAWTRHDVRRLSRRRDDPAGAMRPFDADRDGLVNGEGSAAFLLETRAGAAARGATPLAQILGFAAAFEPNRCTRGRICDNPDGEFPSARSPEAIRRAIRDAMQNAGLAPADLGFVAAHGLGLTDADRIEAQAIRDVLGDVPVTAPSGALGYLGVGSGALETALCVLALRHGAVPPTLNYRRPDPLCPINVVRDRPLPLAIRTAMVISHSDQGQALAVALGEA